MQSRRHFIKATLAAGAGLALAPLAPAVNGFQASILPGWSDKAIRVEALARFIPITDESLGDAVIDLGDVAAAYLKEWMG